MLDEEKYMDSDALVDQVLKQAPAYSLPADFATRVAVNVGRRFAWQQYIREFLIYLAAIIGIVVLSVGMALIWYDNDLNYWLDFLISNLDWIAGINLLFVFVLFTDRVLLRYFLYRSALKGRDK